MCYVLCLTYGGAQVLSGLPSQGGGQSVRLWRLEEHHRWRRQGTINWRHTATQQGGVRSDKEASFLTAAAAHDN